MKIKLLVLTVAILAITGAAIAAPIECNAALSNPASFGLGGNVNTVSVLLGMTSASEGCYEGDVYFSGFTYTPTNAAVEGPGSIEAGASAGFASATGDYAGMALATTVAPWGTGTNGGFTWTYTETLCTLLTCPVANVPNPAEVITGADVQISPAGTSGNVSYVISPGGTGNVFGPGVPNEGFNATEAGIQSVTFTDTYVSGATLSGVTNDVYETLGPEPSTMMLMGGALVGLGVIGRKRRKSS